MRNFFPSERQSFLKQTGVRTRGQTILDIQTYSNTMKSDMQIADAVTCRQNQTDMYVYIIYGPVLRLSTPMGRGNVSTQCIQ